MSMAYKPLAAAAGAVGSMMGVEPKKGPPHWQVEYGGCMEDTNVCLQTACCGPCTMSNLMTKRERGIPMMDPINCLGAICFSWVSYGQFAGALGLALRREIVQRYGIQEEPYCNSILYGVLVPCNYCQIQREMALRDEHPGGIFAKAPNQDSMTQQQFAMARNFGYTMANASVWRSSLFDFAGGEDVIDACCLGCCTLAHMAYRLDAGRSSLVPANAENTLDSKTCIGATCCFPQVHMAVRREVLDRYQIPEPHLVSFAYVAFCGCCSIAQTRREMGYRNEWPGGLVVKTAPQPIA